MSGKLTIRIHLGHHCRLYDLSYIFQQNEARIKVNDILQKVNEFINTIDYTVKCYLNIWIDTKYGRENLFKLKQKGTLISLGLNQNAIYELNIFLEDIEQKQNLMKYFHNSAEQYNRLNNNINRMIEESKEQEKKRGMKQLRPIDIAYFFADPLVAIQKGKIVAKHQVSYQLEYDKFIEIVKKQQFENNFRVQMMVATKTNIKNTLLSGASILHFACHGKLNVGNLQIQNEASIGELVDLDHAQFLSLLDIRTALPKLIIFNVCFSSILAKQVYQRKKIMTIAYEGKAADIYCQMFTKQFYLGVFKNKRPVRELFNQIKEKIMKQDQLEAKKMRIFPQNPQPDEMEQQFLQDTQTKFNYIKRWTLSQSMRQNDSLGVKVQMYQFIKQFLTPRQTMSYVILRGQKNVGKSDFMKKVRIYIMNRKVFSEDFWIDLKLKNKKGQYIQNILQLKLQKEDLIIKKVTEFKQKFKQKKYIPLVIFDHCEKIIKIEYSKFIQYIQHRIIKQIKFGKVVIITNNVVPILHEDEQKLLKAHTHIKENPYIEKVQFNNFVKRYSNSKQVQETALQFSKYWPLIDLVKALKLSKSKTELESKIYQRQQLSGYDNNKKQLNLTIQFIRQQSVSLKQMIEQLRSGLSIRIQENNFIYFSTIFSGLNIQLNQSQISSQSINKNNDLLLQKLIKQFKKFFRKIFKFKKQDEGNFRALQDELSLKKIFEISLGIAGILYFYKNFTLFEEHLINCQTLYNFICIDYIEQLKKQESNIYKLINHYHLQILLTLYSYFTQSYYKIDFLLHYSQSKNIEQDRKNCQIYRKKYKIIENEIIQLYFKDQHQNVQTLFKHIFIIDLKIQQLHFNKKYIYFHGTEGRSRRNSQNYDDQFDGRHIISKIVAAHKSIDEYWKSFGTIIKYQTNSKFIIARESIYILRLNITKLILYNLKQFQQILQKGESYITENMIRMIVYYKDIMINIQNQRPFCHKKQSNGLFKNHQCKSLKPLFQQYLKSYIEVYYNISILYQNFQKEYNLKVYYNLLQLCDTYSTISGIHSIKKMIEEHLNNQFFNTWMCTIFIACPVVETEKKHSDVKKRNIKRYEYSTISFIRNFYENQLDKEIKYNIKIMNKQILQDYQYNTQDSDKRNLIELVICDLKPHYEKDSFKMYMQNQNGALIIEQAKTLILPHAPIVIYFGHNIKELERFYKMNGSQSVIIWINIDQDDCLKQTNTLEKDKKYQLQTYNQYAIYLQIYHTVLQYFYCSFCRHFFNDDSHNYFIDQVRSSYDLAKAQTFIKTKLKYSNDRQFTYTHYITKIVDRIDYNLNDLVKSIDAVHLIQKPAYNFIYKQLCTINKNGKFKIDKKQMLCQIGCNKQINEILYTLNSDRKQTITNVLIYYKSQPMLQFYINTLKAKLYKLGKFIIAKEIIQQKNYHLFRQKSKSQLINSILQDYNKNTQSQQIVTFFVVLSEPHILQQINLITPNKNKQTKIFFTNQRYTSLQNIDRRIIAQNYKDNRLQYELYFLECKRNKTLTVQKEKKCIKVFYETVQSEMNSSASLLDVKNAIDRVISR